MLVRRLAPYEENEERLKEEAAGQAGRGRKGICKGTYQACLEWLRDKPISAPASRIFKFIRRLT